jgi:two-component system NtrC family sensor kinase
LSVESRRRRRSATSRTSNRRDSIAKLAGAAGAIAAGDRALRLPVGPAADLARLAEAVNAIVDVLALKERMLGENIQSLQTVNRELREAQESLLRSEKLAALGRVAAGIAHEIGNPIGAIIGYLDLLRRKDVADDEVRDWLTRIEAEAWRINAIIRELLDFARPSAGVLAPLDVNDVVRSTLGDVGHQPGFATLTITAELADGLPRVEANEQRLRQVVLNLLSNSRDAMQAAGRIAVTTRLVESSRGEPSPRSLPRRRMSDPPEVDYSHLRPVLDYDPTTDRPLAAEPRWVEIRITDTGPGIPSEMLREVFDPFFTTKPPGQGTGLGLPLSLSIVRAFRGRMRIESEVGLGTSVVVQIPAQTDPRP